jgi:hypothetical protein
VRLAIVLLSARSPTPLRRLPRRTKALVWCQTLLVDPRTAATARLKPANSSARRGLFICLRYLVKLRIAEFGPKLGRAVTEGADEDREFEAPPDTILDRVQFLVNNL